MPNDEIIELTGRLIAEFEEEANPDPEPPATESSPAKPVNGVPARPDFPSKPFADNE